MRAARSLTLWRWSGSIEQVGLLIRIVGYVVQLAMVGCAQRELPAVAHNGPPGLRVAEVDLRAAEVAVVDVAHSVPLDKDLVAVERLLATKNGGKALALQVVWHGCAHQVKERGYQVYVAHGALQASGGWWTFQGRA